MTSTRRVANGLPSNPRAMRLAGPATSTVSASGRPEHRRALSQSHSIGQEMRRDIKPRDVKTESRERAHHSHAQHNLSRVNPRLSSDSSSTSSSTSSESSAFWVRDHHSRASSRTTVRSDENWDYQLAESKQGPYPNITASETSSTFAESEYGYVWNRVTAVASVLTQEVSRVWTTGLGTGDDDFVEDDAHLNRVMRAYHLSKARIPQELPDWLFNERERGQGRFDLHNNGYSTTTAAEDRQRSIGADATTKHLENRSMTGQAKLSGTERLKQMRSVRQNGPSGRF